MKKMNRILALTLTLCLLLCLCACGGANEQSFSERMAMAQKNMAALHSVRMETTMDVSMEMSAMGQTQSMDMTVAYVVESNQDSGICRMEMTTTAMGTSQKLLALRAEGGGKGAMPEHSQKIEKFGVGMDRQSIKDHFPPHSF